MHVSGRFGLPSGFVSATGRQACPQGSLVVSGAVLLIWFKRFRYL